MLKRCFDVFVATVALALLSPIAFVVAYKVANNLGKPVLFRQKRPGLKGDAFEMIKFRSMRDALEKSWGQPA